MSVYYGKCEVCGEASSLEAIHPETGGMKKVCFACWDEWLTNKDPGEQKKIDPDDQRKYGRYL